MSELGTSIHKLLAAELNEIEVTKVSGGHDHEHKGKGLSFHSHELVQHQNHYDVVTDSGFDYVA